MTELELTKHEISIEQSAQEIRLLAYSLETALEKHNAIDEMSHHALESMDHESASSVYRRQMENFSLENGFYFDEEQYKVKEGFDIVDTGKRWLLLFWRIIKDVYKRLLRAITDYLSRLFKGVDGLDKHANALMALVEKAESQGHKPLKLSIEIDTATRLSINGHVSGPEVIDGIGNMVEVTGSSVETYIHGVNTLIESLERICDQITSLNETNRDTIEKDIRALNSWPMVVSSDIFDLTRKHRSHQLPGGLYLFVAMSEFTPQGFPRTMPRFVLSTNHQQYRMRRSGGVLTQIRDAKDGIVSYIASVDPDRTTVKPLDTGTMRIVIRECRSALLKMGRAEANINALTLRFTQLQKKAERIFDNPSTRELMEEHLHRHTIQMLLWYYNMSLPGSVNNVYTYQYSVVRAHLAYVRNSLKVYGEEA